MRVHEDSTKISVLRVQGFIALFFVLGLGTGYFMRPAPVVPSAVGTQATAHTQCELGDVVSAR